MKKIITALLFVMSTLFFTSVNAQQKATKKSTTKTSTVKAKDAPTTTPPLKKDGTADMRYKENKMKAKPVGPLKKDGTADMRYKTNKPKTTTKK